MRGIEVDSDTLSFAEIERICCSGEGHDARLRAEFPISLSRAAMGR